MLKLMLLAAAVAVLVVGGFVALPGVGAEVSASTASASTVSAGTEPAKKGDRLDRIATPPPPPADVCSQRGWPYYDTKCLTGTQPTKPVRIIALDRI